MPEESKPGSIVHVEIHSADPAKTRSFYETVFGWKMQLIPEMDYTLFTAPNAPHGGIMSPMEGRGPQVLNYLLTPDVEATSKKIQKAGGTIVVPKQEIPNMGWYAIFQEPGGTFHAIYESRPKPSPAKKPAAKKAAGGKRKK